MPSMDDIYGGDALKAEDFPQNKRVLLTVERVSERTLKARDGKGEERKLALHFHGREKVLLLNVTNANMMAEISGSRDYDNWPGNRVTLYRTMTDFGGKRVPALRLDHPPVVQTQAPPPPPVDPGYEPDAGDDETPF